MHRVGGIYAELSLRYGEFTQGLREATKAVRQAATEMETALGTGPQQALEQLGQQAQATAQEIQAAFADLDLTTGEADLGPMARQAEQMGQQIRTAFGEETRTQIATTGRYINVMYQRFGELGAMAIATGRDIYRALGEHTRGQIVIIGRYINRLYTRFAELGAMAIATGRDIYRAMGHHTRGQIVELGRYINRLFQRLGEVGAMAIATGRDIHRAFGDKTRNQFVSLKNLIVRLGDTMSHAGRRAAGASGTMRTALGVLLRKQITSTRLAVMSLKKSVDMTAQFVAGASGSMQRQLGDALRTQVQDTNTSIETLSGTTEDLARRAEGAGAAFGRNLGETARKHLDETRQVVERVRTAVIGLAASTGYQTKEMEAHFSALQTRAIIPTAEEVSGLRGRFTTMAKSAQEQLATIRDAIREITFDHIDTTRLTEGLEQAATRVQEFVTQVQQVGAEDVATVFDRMAGAAQRLTESLRGLVTEINHVVQGFRQLGETDIGARRIGQQIQSTRLDLNQFSSDMDDVRRRAQDSGRELSEGMGERPREQIRETTKEVRRAGDRISRTSRDTNDKVQRGTEETRKKAARVTWAVRGYIKDTARVVTGILIARTFYMLLKRIEQMISAAYELKLTFEEAALSFEYLLDTTEAGAARYARSMRDWAIDTQYSIREMTDAFRDLYFTGVMSIKDTESAMQILAGTATATGRPLNELVSVMRRIATATHLSTSELRALTRAGIDVGPMLQEHLGLTAEELREINRLAIPGRTAFQAIMLGMQDYAEAAVDGADTTRARWADLMEVIADSIGLITEDLYDAWVDTLTGMLDWMAALRHGLMELGPIALVKLFPPGVRDNLETVLASLNAIWDAIRRVGRLVRVVLGNAFAFFTAVLARVLPLLARATQWLGWLADRARQSSAAVRVLVTSIGALTISVVAAAAVKHLVSWLAKLTGAAQVATTALAWLKTIVLVTARNIHVLIAALALLLGNLDRIRGALGGLTDSIRQSFGLFEDFQYRMDEQHMKDVADRMTEIGDAAEDAGEKAADAFDPFLAAFDEVYQIPEETGAAADEMEKDFDVDIEMPDIDIPTMRDLEWPDIAGTMAADFETGFGDIIDTMEGFADWFRGWRGWAIAAFALLGGELVRWLFRSFFRTFSLLGIGGMLKFYLGTYVLGPIKKFFWVTLLPFLKKTLLGIPIAGWIAAALLAAIYVWYRWGDDIKEWFNNTFVPWLRETWDTIVEIFWDAVDWIKEAGGDFVQWFVDLPDNIGEYLEIAKDWLYEFFTETIPWALGYAVGRLGRWIRETYDDIAEWVITTIAQFARWGAGIVDTIVEWLMKLPGRIWKWLGRAGDTLTEWVPKIRREAVKFGKAILDGIIDTIVGLPRRVGEIFGNVVDTIGDWITGAKDTARKVGENVTKGYEEGMEAESPTRIERIMEAVSENTSKTMEAMTRIFRQYRRPIKTAWRGLADEIRSIWVDLLNKVQEVFQKIMDMAGDIQVDPSGTMASPMSGLQRTSPARREELGQRARDDDLRAFAKMLAREIAKQPQPTPIDDRDILYVDTLVADNRGLKELERRMKIIRTREKDRTGGES